MYESTQKKLKNQWLLMESLLQEDSQNNLGQAAAIYNGHLEVMKYLISKGADIHAENDLALRVASNNGHLDVVEYLKSVMNQEKSIQEQLSKITESLINKMRTL